MNKEHPLVSVIIPTYNRANILSQAILSVISQSYQNWELIIVDDGSTDNTKNVVEEFTKSDKRIKYIYQENKGQPSAMNTGIKNSAGYFIAFLDDDDQWMSRKLEKQVDLFNKDKEIALVFTDAIIQGGKLNSKKSSDISKPYSGYVYKHLLRQNFITASSVMVKKEVLEKCGLFDESPIIKTTQMQDYDMWLRICKKYKIGYIPEILVKYNYVNKINNLEKRIISYYAMLYILNKNLEDKKIFLNLTYINYFLKWRLFKLIFILKNHGLKIFIKKVFRFYINRIDLLKQERAQRKAKNNPQLIIKSLKSFSSNDPEEIFNFSWNFYSGLIRPTQIKEEFLELLKIFKEINPKYVLEIGTAKGGNLFCFCKLARDDATIISIDLPEEQFGGGYPEWKIPIYQAFAKENQKLYLLRKDSHSKETLEEVKKILNGNQLDFLFIDGDHSYEGVKKDFEMYSPLVRKGGIIAFHDIVNNDPSRLDIEVPKFFNEIKGNYLYKEFIIDKINYGIGILKI